MYNYKAIHNHLIIIYLNNFANFYVAAENISLKEFTMPGVKILED